MGRGRAKAKQTKVARELKYNSPQTDLAALQAELARNSGRSDENRYTESDDDEDPYAKYLNEDEADES